MLARVEGTQSGGAVYRRVVLRNVICTAGIIASYAITTLIVVIALLRESTHNNKVKFVSGNVGSIVPCGHLHTIFTILQIRFSFFYAQGRIRYRYYSSISNSIAFFHFRTYPSVVKKHRFEVYFFLRYHGIGSF